MATEADETAFQQVIALAQQWSSCLFTRYNPSTLRRRVERRMIDVRCHTTSDYLAYLERHPPEYPRLIAALTIKVSHFFRDPEVFALIEQGVIPRLKEETVAAKRAEMRIWSAACASGEEAYSMAMLVAEASPPATALAPSLPRISILGTDVDPAALATAAKGVYPEDDLRQVSEPLRQRYFCPPASGPNRHWQVAPQLRQMVDFVPFDLTSPSRLSPPSGIFSEYDLILCRNMLIYCQPPLKGDIIRRLHTCLRPNGYLILGRSESLPEAYQGHFVPLDPRLKVYRKKETT